MWAPRAFAILMVCLTPLSDKGEPSVGSNMCLNMSSPGKSRGSGRRSSLHVVDRSEVPVRDVPERLEVASPVVAPVDVIRVFPHVTDQQRFPATPQRVVGIVRV